MARFAPTTLEVEDARKILVSRKLPMELALIILEFARYWPEITTESVAHRVIRDDDWSLEFSKTHLFLWELFPEEPGKHVKLKEIEFTIVSHDQGWTTENTTGTYQTSSWFDAAIFRPIEGYSRPYDPSEAHFNFMHPRHPARRSFNTTDEDEWTNMEAMRRFYVKFRGWDMVPRPSQHMETNRSESEAMKMITWPEGVSEEDVEEGKHSWYLQGNQVARSTSVFEGEMVKRYHVVWGSKDNPRFEGNEGAGRGLGFVDSLREGDVIGVFANAKRRGWENHVYGVRMTMRYSF